MWYVYIDFTLENIVRAFYVGKGRKNRTYRIGRNKHHTNIRNKYGINRVLVYCSKDENDALNAEVILIKEHRTYVYADDYLFGANYSIGGHANSGCKLTSEQLSRLVENVTKSWQDPIARQNHLNSLHKPETIAMISEKCRFAQKKNWQDPVYRINQSESIRIAQNKEETRKKRSASVRIAQTKLWQNKEYREKQTKKQQEVWKDEKLLQKLRKPQKCSICGELGHKKTRHRE